MNIETVKLQGNGYLLNGSMSVPNDSGNREYQLIQEWIALGNTPEPEFTQAELDAQALTNFKQTVLAEITKTDVTMARIQQGVILGTCAYTNADVVAFVQYIKDLRGLLSATAPMTLPTPPAYPSGT